MDQDILDALVDLPEETQIAISQACTLSLLPEPSQPYDPLTYSQKREVLVGIILHGTIGAGLRRAGISRRLYWNWIQADENFSKAVDGAMDELADGMEEIAIDRARKGSDTLLLEILRALKKSKYRAASTVEHTGTIKHDHQIKPHEKILAALQSIADKRQMVLSSASENMADEIVVEQTPQDSPTK